MQSNPTLTQRNTEYRLTLSIVKPIGNGEEQTTHSPEQVHVVFLGSADLMRELQLSDDGTLSLTIPMVALRAWTLSPTSNSYSKKRGARPKASTKASTLHSSPMSN